MSNNPSHWDNCLLGERVQFQYGKSPSGVRLPGGRYPVYGSSGKTSEAIEFTTDAPSIIVGRKGTIDKPIFLEEQCWAIDTTFFIDKFPLDDPKYLFYLLDSINLRSLNESTGVPSLSRDALHSISVSLPPLPEQKKIAEILSGIDLFKYKLSEKSGKLEKLLASLSFHLLSGETCWGDANDAETRLVPSDWLVVNVGSVAQSIVPGRNKPKKFDGDIPWITISDLSDFIICRSKKGLSVSRNSLSDAGGKTVPKNSVVLSVVGSFGLSSVTGVEVALNQQLHAFVCGNQILPEFLSLCIRNSEEKLERLATQTTISYINKQNIESLLIPLPSLEEQKKIVSIVSSLRNTFFCLNRQMIQLDCLKSSLSSDLLSGRKRVSI